MVIIVSACVAGAAAGARLIGLRVSVPVALALGSVALLALSVINVASARLFEAPPRSINWKLFGVYEIVSVLAALALWSLHRAE